MLTKRQYIIRQKSHQLLEELEQHWSTALKNIGYPYMGTTGHPSSWEVHRYRIQAMTQLERLGPWLLGEKASLRRIEEIIQPVSGINLVLRPDAEGGKTVEIRLADILRNLPDTFFDHLPFSGLIPFIKKALP